MNSIYHAVQLARTRLLILDVLRRITTLAVVALAGLIGARLVERTFGFALPWQTIALWTAIGVVAIGTAWAFITRQRVIDAARTLDDRANLRESLSTALYVKDSKDAWAQAVIDTANTKAATVNVNSAIPFEAPKHWSWAMGAALALMIVWMTVPAMDVLGLLAKKKDAEQKKQELQLVTQEVKVRQQKLEELLAKAKVDAKQDEPQAPADKPAEPMKPEDVRRDALKNLTQIAEKLQAEKTSDKALQLDGLKNAMLKLRPTEAGPLDQFSKNLAKGDFKQAQEELDKLKAQLANKNMNDAEKAQAAEQLKKMAGQLAKLAADTKSVEKKLTAAGMDAKQAAALAKQLMSNPQAASEAMKQALEAMKNLTPEQREQLAKEASSQSKAGQKMSELAKSMSKCSSGMQNGEGQKSGEGMSEMSQQLSEMEAMSSEMQATEAAMSECKSAIASLCQGKCNGNGDGAPKSGELAWKDSNGQWREGESQGQQGGGKGGPGQSGGGGGGQESASDFTMKTEKAHVAARPGAIINRKLVEGESIKNDSKADFQAAVAEASQKASNSTTNNRIPREYQEAVKKYYGRLDDAAKGKPADAAPAAAPADKK